MKRLLEWIFGLDSGFLNQEGDLSIQFHPRWPGQHALAPGSPWPLASCCSWDSSECNSAGLTFTHL